MPTLLAADSLNLLEITTGLLGGLALFLYGMNKLSEALQAAAGAGMKKVLGTLTRNRFTAAFSGAAITAVIQSSSVTTVLVVGFVSAGLMTLNQSIGIIMGANVGTTVTAQIVAFKVTKLAWAMIALGFGVWLLSRRDHFRQWGAMIMGLGMLFVGMDQMSVATGPLRTYEPFIDLMQRMDNPFLAILVGAVFTALVQSSSATMGIVIMLASQGFLSLEAGIALIIGAKVGTCATAVLSAIGKPTDAVRAAVVHVLFNLIGAIIWVWLIPQLAWVATAISPSATDLEGVSRMAAETPRQVANAATLYTTGNLALLIWFTGPIAWLATRLVRERPSAEQKRVHVKHLDPIYLESPVAAIEQIRYELVHMGECVQRMLDAVRPAIDARSATALTAIRKMDDDVDRLQLAILDFIRSLSRQQLSTDESRSLSQQVAIANYLESTGDLIETNLVEHFMRRLERGDTPIPEVSDVGRELWGQVGEALGDVLRALKDNDADLARDIAGRKAGVHATADRAVETLGALMVADPRIDLDAFRIGSDVIGQVKRIFYNIRKIADIIAAGDNDESDESDESDRRDDES